MCFSLSECVAVDLYIIRSLRAAHANSPENVSRTRELLKRREPILTQDAAPFYVSACGFFGDELIELVQKDEVVGVLRSIF